MDLCDSESYAQSESEYTTTNSLLSPLYTIYYLQVLSKYLQ